MATLAEIIEAQRAQAAKVAASGFVTQRQGQQSVTLPDPLKMAQALRITREEASATDPNREIFGVVSQAEDCELL